VRTGPYTAVREVTLTRFDRKRPTIHVCDIIVADDMFAL
jgi:hypothetical protein